MKNTKQSLNLLNDLKTIDKQLRFLMNNKWKRDLPFTELLFDRWERAKFLKFGLNSNIYHNSYIYGNVKVGKNTWIGPFTLLDGTGNLKIGDNCNISAGTQIYTHDTVKRALSGGKYPREAAPVTIGNNCFLGPNSIISKGVVIGHHSIIGAQAYVNKSIPPYSVAVGVPAKIIGKVKLKNSEITISYFPKTAQKSEKS